MSIPTETPVTPFHDLNDSGSDTSPRSTGLASPGQQEPIASTIAAMVERRLSIATPPSSPDSSAPNSRVPSAGSQRPSEPAKSKYERVITILMVAAVFIMWSCSMTVNTTSGGLIPSSHWRLFISMATAGQGTGLLIVMILMRSTGQIPKKLDVPSMATTFMVQVPLTVLPVANAVVIFLKSRGNDLSLVLPVLSLYLLVPTLYGLVYRGEKKNLSKLIGIGMCLAASLVMGFASASSSDDEEDEVDVDSAAVPETDSGSKKLSMVVVWVLLGALVALWGVGDTVSVSISRRLVTFQVAMYSCMGAFILSASMGLWDIWVSPYPSAFELAHLKILIANLVSSLAWFLLTQLGKRGSASVFVPVIGLHSLAPAVYQLVIGEEQVSALKIVGLGLAALAVLLIGRKPSSYNWGKTKAAVRAKFLAAAVRFKSGGRGRALWKAKVVAAAAEAAKKAVEQEIRRRTESGSFIAPGRVGDITAAVASAAAAAASAPHLPGTVSAL